MRTYWKWSESWPHGGLAWDKSKVNVCSVTQMCLTLFDPMGCSPPGSSVHGISQARMLEWVAIPSSRGSSWPRDLTCVSWIHRHWQVDSLPLRTGEAQSLRYWTNLMWVADREDSEYVMRWRFSENTVCLRILWCWSWDKREICSCTNTTTVTERGGHWSLRHTERKKTQCNSTTNNKQNEKTTYRTGGNICKWCNWKWLNF